MQSMPDLENDLLALLSDVARHLRRHGDQLAQRHRMTLAQLTILARLEHESDISQRELAALTGLSPMTIARWIDRLEEHGLVKRCADAQDARIWRLRLTPAAAPLTQEIKRLRAKLFLVGTRGMNASVLCVMAQGLRQIKASVSDERLIKVSA